MANPVGPSGNWTLVFEDDFPGSSLNTANWTALQGASINGVTTQASAVSVSGGYLRVGYAGAVNSSPVNGYSGPSTGPALAVGDCVEAYINFPGPSGDQCYNWPAWWATGANWPANGEEDIFEGYGSGVPSALNYHSPSGVSNGPFPSGSWCGSFHTYTLVRGETSLQVWWDGVLERTVTRNDGGGSQGLIINAGSGSVASTGAVILVGYVRMWTPSSGPSPVTSTGSVSLQGFRTSGTAAASTAGNIAQDASTPAAVTASGSAGTSLTTAAFSPPANTLLVVLTSFEYQAANANTPVFTVTDSVSGTYTAGPSVSDGSRGMAAIWTRYLYTAPGSMTVTVTNSGPAATHGQVLAVYVLDNAGSVQAKGATAAGHSATAVTAWTEGITSTVSGSWVLAAGAGSALGTVAPLSTTTGLLDDQDSTDQVSLLTGRQCAATVTPGAVTLGWTSSAPGLYALALQEILPLITPPPPSHAMARQAVKRAASY